MQVRKTTASKLYEAIVSYDVVIEDDKMEEVVNVLSETQWSVCSIFYKKKRGISPIFFLSRLSVDISYIGPEYFMNSFTNSNEWGFSLIFL